MNKFGLEIPSINSILRLQNMVSSAKKYDVVVNQYNEVSGSRLIPISEKKEMLECAKENNVGLTFSISTRPEYSINSAFYRSDWGKVQARRIASNASLEYSIEEVLNLIEIGCTGIILYDIGLLSLLNKLRLKNKIPNDIIFKVSSHCAVTNHETASVYSNCGANDIIPIHDTSLISLQEMRKSCPNTVLSIIIDTYKNKGGFIRLKDINQITELNGINFLKLGNSLHSDPYGSQTDNTDLIMRRVRAITEAITNDNFHSNRMSTTNKYACLPK